MQWRNVLSVFQRGLKCLVSNGIKLSQLSKFTFESCNSVRSFHRQISQYSCLEGFIWINSLLDDDSSLDSEDDYRSGRSKRQSPTTVFLKTTEAPGRSRQTNNWYPWVQMATDSVGLTNVFFPVCEWSKLQENELLPVPTQTVPLE